MEYAYISIDDGYVRAAIADTKSHKEHVAVIVASWIKEGKIVERVPLKTAQKILGKRRKEVDMENPSLPGVMPAAPQPTLLTETLFVFDECCEDGSSYCPYLINRCSAPQCKKYGLEYLFHRLNTPSRCDACKKEFPNGLELRGRK